MSAAQYLRDVSNAMHDRYSGDCVTHACRLVELLLAEGREPWIGRLRHWTTVREQPFRLPLVPVRFAGARELPAWSTHYVACAGNEVYDPLLDAPIAIDAYTETVFGMAVEIETLLDAETTARLARNGELRRAMR
ncbi:MAG TPA: hypothetical protein VHK90_04240 [Thermoanaerobaculia bacterium]|nr:hypothetical protein [Thermoanaerobaculia bacterium]